MEEIIWRTGIRFQSNLGFILFNLSWDCLQGSLALNKFPDIRWLFLHKMSKSACQSILIVPTVMQGSDRAAFLLEFLHVSTKLICWNDDLKQERNKIEENLMWKLLPTAQDSRPARQTSRKALWNRPLWFDPRDHAALTQNPNQPANLVIAAGVEQYNCRNSISEVRGKVKISLMQFWQFFFVFMSCPKCFHQFSSKTMFPVQDHTACHIHHQNIVAFQTEKSIQWVATKIKDVN